MGSLPGMEDRTVTIGSLSKTYSVTGWRVGYALADAGLSGRIPEDPRFSHGRCTSPAPACGGRCPQPSRHRIIVDWPGTITAGGKSCMRALPTAGFDCRLPQGAYYIFTDISGFGMTDVAFARHLIETVGVAASRAVRSAMTGEQRNFRFTFSKKDETLHEACRRLEHLG